MPFNTERLITEIQNRPCLWNINIDEYSNRVLKQSGWNEIAEILYNDWLHLEENIKTNRGMYIYSLIIEPHRTVCLYILTNN